jgi:sulfopyruvate decarboxylase subunit alpha
MAQSESSIVAERAQAAARGLERLQLDYLAFQPSNIIAPIINHFMHRPADAPGPELLLASREEEAVGIVGGALLAGKAAAILMQDNGFGNALTALTTFGVAYHLPLLIVANTRGGLGEYNSMIHTISAHAREVLEAVDIPVVLLDRTHSLESWEASIEEAGNHARQTHRPVVALMEFWGPA